jgi:hypothetical protein
VATENAQSRGRQKAGSTSENTGAPSPVRRGRVPSELSGVYAVALEEYVEALAAAPLAQQTRRTYASKVRQYLAWLAGADVDGEPLLSAEGRDWAVRDYRTQDREPRRPSAIAASSAAVTSGYSSTGSRLIALARSSALGRVYNRVVSSRA